MLKHPQNFWNDCGRRKDLTVGGSEAGSGFGSGGSSGGFYASGMERSRGNPESPVVGSGVAVGGNLPAERSKILEWLRHWQEKFPTASPRKKKSTEFFRRYEPGANHGGAG